MDRSVFAISVTKEKNINIPLIVMFILSLYFIPYSVLHTIISILMGFQLVVTIIISLFLLTEVKNHYSSIKDNRFLKELVCSAYNDMKINYMKYQSIFYMLCCCMLLSAMNGEIILMVLFFFNILIKELWNYRVLKIYWGGVL